MGAHGARAAQLGALRFEREGGLMMDRSHGKGVLAMFAWRRDFLDKDGQVSAAAAASYVT